MGSPGRLMGHLHGEKPLTIGMQLMLVRLGGGGRVGSFRVAHLTGWERKTKDAFEVCTRVFLLNEWGSV